MARKAGRPKVDPSEPRKGKRGRKRIYDRKVARKRTNTSNPDGRSDEQRAYAKVIAKADYRLARRICDRFEQEIPNWRNGEWEAKMKVAKEELALHRKRQRKARSTKR